MKLGNIILVVILGAIGYNVYSKLQAPPPPASPVAQAIPTPAPVRAPLTLAPVTPALVAAAPVTSARSATASPTPSNSWIYSVASTPYDQTKSPNSGRRR